MRTGAKEIGIDVYPQLTHVLRFAVRTTRLVDACLCDDDYPRVRQRLSRGWKRGEDASKQRNDAIMTKHYCHEG